MRAPIEICGFTIKLLESFSVQIFDVRTAAEFQKKFNGSVQVFSLGNMQARFVKLIFVINVRSTILR